MRKDSTIAELLERLDEEIQNPKDSVHKIVLKITIDNIKKLIKWIESGYFFFFVSFFYFLAKKIISHLRILNAKEKCRNFTSEELSVSTENFIPPNSFLTLLEKLSSTKFSNT